MAVSDSYREYVLEQLHRAVPPVRGRSMFGGVGIYSGDAFFALIADDVLYLKTDPATQAEFELRGMPPFRPFGEDGGAMSYHQLPGDVLENLDALREWAERAIAVARRKKGRGGKRRGA
jgi:DNA transformation protein